MERITFVLLALVCLSFKSWAADLSQVNRTIGKLPAFQSERPEYCLLVFGPDAARRVWLVRDGSKLYIDRNGNGDLTEPGEQVLAEASSRPEEGIYGFLAGDILDEPRSHKDLRISIGKMDHIVDIDAYAKALVERDPAARMHKMQLDVAIPGRAGNGVEGRVPYTNWSGGILQFSPLPENAPILHFGGPLSVVGGVTRMEVGRSTEFNTAIGTPGLGSGTTVCMGYQGVIPATVIPVVKIAFPPVSEDQPSITQTFELARRCCEINLYDMLKVPGDMGLGEAHMEVSVESWPGAFVAPLVRNIRIVPAGPGPTLEPVSPRLVDRLVHDQADAWVGGIHFSPDGKRLLAGNVANGTFNVWDVASGRRLSTISVGGQYLPLNDYFAISADWRTMFVPNQGKSTLNKVEIDGRATTMATYSGSLRTWDIDTGALKQSIESTPPRRVFSLSSVPDAGHFVTLEEASGERTEQSVHFLSLWDSKTLEHRYVCQGSHVFPVAWSPGGRTMAVADRADDPAARNAISIRAIPAWTEERSIRLESKLSDFDSAAFAANGQVLLASVRTLNKPEDYQHFRCSLKAWDLRTGKEIFSIDAPDESVAFVWISVSPDGQTAAVTTLDFSTNTRVGKLCIVDLATGQAKFLDPMPGASLRAPRFHPSGKWMVVPSQVYPADYRPGPNPKVELFEQPRLIVLDTSGNVLETLISPQSYDMSTAFSPDGNTLATSGNGQVLLWDFRTPPGQFATQSP